MTAKHKHCANMALDSRGACSIKMCPTCNQEKIEHEAGIQHASLFLPKSEEMGETRNHISPQL